MLDVLEAKREETEEKLAASSDPVRDDLSAKMVKPYDETKRESVELIINTWLHYVRNHAHPDVTQPLIDIVRMPIRKAAVGIMTRH